MKMFITSKNKYLSNDMKIFGTCSIPLTAVPRKSITSINILCVMTFESNVASKTTSFTHEALNV